MDHSVEEVPEMGPLLIEVLQEMDRLMEEVQGMDQSMGEHQEPDPSIT